jgi:hypothetical protein
MRRIEGAYSKRRQGSGPGIAHHPFEILWLPLENTCRAPIAAVPKGPRNGDGSTGKPPFALGFGVA